MHSCLTLTIEKTILLTNVIWLTHIYRQIILYRKISYLWSSRELKTLLLMYTYFAESCSVTLFTQMFKHWKVRLWWLYILYIYIYIYFLYSTWHICKCICITVCAPHHHALSLRSLHPSVTWCISFCISTLLHSCVYVSVIL